MKERDRQLGSETEKEPVTEKETERRRGTDRGTDRQRGSDKEKDGKVTDRQGTDK